MNKKTWDLYAPIYQRAMKADQKIYDFMYERIPEAVKGKEVLEIAAGPGLLAKHIAPAAKSVLATDYSDGMIKEAKKGDCPANVRCSPFWAARTVSPSQSSTVTAPGSVVWTATSTVGGSSDNVLSLTPFGRICRFGAFQSTTGR